LFYLRLGPSRLSVSSPLPAPFFVHFC
jgi:hypothetical protein